MKDAFVVVKHVDRTICDNCGEAYYDPSNYNTDTPTNRLSIQEYR